MPGGFRILNHTLAEDDIVCIGHSTFRLKNGELRQYVDEGEITIAANELLVKVPGGKVLLDRVTFPIPEKSLLGIGLAVVFSLVTWIRLRRLGPHRRRRPR